MMDTPAFMHYDARAGPSAHVQQRAMSQQYVVAPAYSAAPMTAMPAQAPHYHPQPFAYAPYHSSPPMTPIGSPFQQDYQERPVQGYMTPPRRGSVQVKNSSGLNTPARSNSIVSMAPSVGSNPNACSKKITYNETINPADRVDFQTDVDELMKAIQIKAEAKANAAAQGQAPTPVHTPCGETNMDAQSPASSCQASVASSGQEVKPKKKWVCDGPNCNKRFVQKTHLDIHRRTHTGLKPYICTKPNCGLTFSQRGNLKVRTLRCNKSRSSGKY